MYFSLYNVNRYSRRRKATKIVFKAKMLLIFQQVPSTYLTKKGWRSIWGICFWD